MRHLEDILIWLGITLGGMATGGIVANLVCQILHY